VNRLRHSIRRSGRASGSRGAQGRCETSRVYAGCRRATVLLVSAVLASGCFWRYGFAGGGLPAHIKSLAILPFDNETATAELQQQLYTAMQKSVGSRLGLRDASESHADAVIRGTILRYDTDIPIGYSAQPGVTAAGVSAGAVSPTRRQLELAVSIQIIDQSTGNPIWKRDGLVATGQYSEGDETSGRKLALQKMVDLIVEGAQSQW